MNNWDLHQLVLRGPGIPCLTPVRPLRPTPRAVSQRCMWLHGVRMTTTSARPRALDSADTQVRRTIVHRNTMKGKKGKHTIRDWLRQRGLAATARNISSAGVYASAVHADADVSALQQSLQIYWQTNQVGEGVSPEDCLLQLGSRIQLWAPGTHANIGFAYGHPDMDGRVRYCIDGHNSCRFYAGRHANLCRPNMCCDAGGHQSYGHRHETGWINIA